MFRYDVLMFDTLSGVFTVLLHKAIGLHVIACVCNQLCIGVCVFGNC